MTADDMIDRAVKDRAMNAVGEFLVGEARRNCPVDIGHLHASISYKIQGDTIVLFSHEKYAGYVEFGCGKYHLDEKDVEKDTPDPRKGWDIVPINEGNVLAWEVGKKARLAAGGKKKDAKMAFARKVHIEGIRPHPFIRPAFYQNKSRIAEILGEELGKK